MQILVQALFGAPKGEDGRPVASNGKSAEASIFAELLLPEDVAIDEPVSEAVFIDAVPVRSAFFPSAPEQAKSVISVSAETVSGFSNNSMAQDETARFAAAVVTGSELAVSDIAKTVPGMIEASVTDNTKDEPLQVSLPDTQEFSKTLAAAQIADTNRPLKTDPPTAENQNVIAASFSERGSSQALTYFADGAARLDNNQSKVREESGAHKLQNSQTTDGTEPEIRPRATKATMAIHPNAAAPTRQAIAPTLTPHTQKTETDVTLSNAAEADLVPAQVVNERQGLALSTVAVESPVPKPRDATARVRSGERTDETAALRRDAPTSAAIPTPAHSRTTVSVVQPEPMTELSARRQEAVHLPDLTTFLSIPEFESEEVRIQGSTSVRSDAMARPVMVQISQMIARTNMKGTIEVRLSPEELGRVKVSMSHADTGITVHITAERPETLDLMRRNIDMLESDLRDQGFQDLSFSFGQDGAREHANNDGSKARDEAPKISPSVRVDIAASPATVSDGRLDIRL